MLTEKCYLKNYIFFRFFSASYPHHTHKKGGKCLSFLKVIKDIVKSSFSPQLSCHFKCTSSQSVFVKWVETRMFFSPSYYISHDECQSLSVSQQKHSDWPASIHHIVSPSDINHHSHPKAHSLSEWSCLEKGFYPFQPLTGQLMNEFVCLPSWQDF